MIVDPNVVGVDRVRITVDNGFGTASELVTVKYEDRLAPVLNPTYTVKVEPSAMINWVPKGTYLTPLSGDRVRKVHWEATNLPEGVSLDPDTGRLSGRVISVGSYQSILTCYTNCGKATSRLYLEVYPTKIELAENPYQIISGKQCLCGRSLYEFVSYTDIVCIKVSPPGGSVSWPSGRKRLACGFSRYGWYRGKWCHQMSYGGSYSNTMVSTSLDHIEMDDMYTYIYANFTLSGGGSFSESPYPYLLSFGNATYTYGSLQQSIPVTYVVTGPGSYTYTSGSSKTNYYYSWG